MFITRKFFAACVIASAIAFNVYGQSNWSIHSSLQYASGNYLYTERLNSYFLYGGIRYETMDYSIDLSIPFIASNGQNASQFGNIYMPNHMGSVISGMGGGPGGHGGGHIMGNADQYYSSSPEYYGIGDLNLYANYNLLNQFSSALGWSIGGYIKFPTASTANGFGTGKFDFSLSTTIKKNFGTYLVYASGGYIALGEPDSLNYTNPYTLNIGVGKLFNDGDVSALISYSLYSKILDAYQMPQELSLGLNIMSNNKITYTFIGSAGLSNSTPDFVLSAGLKYNLGG
jgi:hypothetical protein